MRIYEDHQVLDEWAITYTLELKDNGKFFYDECWGCYAGSSRRGADGRWWQSGKTIFLHTERADEYISLDLVPGCDRIATEEADALRFSKWLTYRLHKETAHNLQPSKNGVLSVPFVSDAESPIVAPAPNSASVVEKNESHKLSPELAARISQLIDELTAKGIQDRIARLGQKFNILPLHTNSIYMWGVNTEGVVMWLDHELLSDRPERITDPLTIYAVMIHGVRKYRELAELIPTCPAGARQCKECGGMGWKKLQGKGSESCLRCESLGWCLPTPVR